MEPMRPKKYKLKQINNFQSEQNNNFPQMKYLTKSGSMQKMKFLIIIITIIIILLISLYMIIILMKKMMN